MGNWLGLACLGLGREKFLSNDLFERVINVYFNYTGFHISQKLVILFVYSFSDYFGGKTADQFERIK